MIGIVFLVALALWVLLVADAYWLSGARARAAARRPEAEQAVADPAELHPGMAVLAPNGAQRRLALVGTPISAVILLFIAMGAVRGDSVVFLLALLAAPILWLNTAAIGRALESVHATSHGVLHRTWRGRRFHDWQLLQTIRFDDGSLLLSFSDAQVHLRRNLAGLGWLADAARRSLAAQAAGAQSWARSGAANRHAAESIPEAYIPAGRAPEPAPVPPREPSRDWAPPPRPAPAAQPSPVRRVRGFRRHGDWEGSR